MKTCILRVGCVCLMVIFFAVINFLMLLLMAKTGPLISSYVKLIFNARILLDFALERVWKGGRNSIGNLHILYWIIKDLWVTSPHLYFYYALNAWVSATHTQMLHPFSKTCDDNRALKSPLTRSKCRIQLLYFLIFQMFQVFPRFFKG